MMLFMPIESPERVLKVGILAAIGLDGLHGLAQVWIALPPMPLVQFILWTDSRRLGKSAMAASMAA